MHYTDLTCSCTLNNYSALFPDVSKLSFDQVYTWYNKDNVKQGWVIYVSVHHDILNDTITDFVRFLLNTGEPFAVPKDYNVAVSITSGELGFDRIGKLIMVYPSSDASANKIAKELVQRAAGKLYLKVLNTFHVGEGVYADYMNSADTPLGVFDIIANRKRLKGILKMRRWPFLTDKKFSALNKLWNGRYLVTAYLKSDQKGFVAEGLLIRPIWRIREVILKYAYHGACIDDQMRDMRSRLYSQVAIHDRLSAIDEVPKLFGNFDVDEDSVLVLENIKGENLQAYAAAHILPLPWYKKNGIEKQELLSIIVGVLEIVDKAHDAQVVHRDLSANNFIIREGKVVGLIDWELGYILNQQNQSAPYEYGTLGFMSKEQLSGKAASIYDDITALGALFAYLFTGIIPTRYSFNTSSRINEQLKYFTHSKEVAAIISQCFCNPSGRPSIEQMLLFFRSSLLVDESETLPNTIDLTIQKQDFRYKILDKIDVLANIKRYYNPFNKTIEDDDIKVLKVYGCSIAGGLAGILYFLGRVTTSQMSPLADKIVEILKDDVLQRQNDDLSFMYGKIGVAFALISWMEAGNLSHSDTLQSIIRELTVCNKHSLSINYGIAGTGLVYLKLYKLFGDNETKDMLGHVIHQLLQAPGLFIDTGSADYNYPGFLNGGSGILYVLLKASATGDFNIDKAVLKKACLKITEWKDRFNNPYEGFSIEQNFKFLDTKVCVIRLLLLGYEILRDYELRDVAVVMLDTVDVDSITTNLSLASGISYFGFLFLEAYKVLGNDTYLQKASQVAEMIWYCSISSDDGSTLFWFNDLELEPHPGYMFGYTGVIDFLHAYYTNDIRFPIFE